MSEVHNPIPPAVVPRFEGVSDILQPLPGETREEMWRRLGAEARSDPAWAGVMDRPPIEGPTGRALEKNPEWANFGLRGRVASLLWESGLKRKAIRFANCGRLGRPGVCSRYPDEHRFFEPHRCGVVFCRECAALHRSRLFGDYSQVVLEVLREHGLPPGWVLARINFTLRSDGSDITPHRVMEFNRAVRKVMQKTVGSPRSFGMLFLDEVESETRGQTGSRKTDGLNLHCHGTYFGPPLHWERTRDLWKAETERRFGLPSFGFYVRKVRGLERDPERALRHALNRMLKYVSKPPAIAPERLSKLISAFDGARRVHSLGLFYGHKLKHEQKDSPCPRCRTLGIPGSVVSFEGRRLSNGGCVPRLVPIEDLRAGGYEDLQLARRAAFFAHGGPPKSGAGPP